ncbi:MAG: hypothetical protein EBY45_08785 [Gammaproteobacteria bacterium]|nr:hypothetical protein [Gammaproteobacteria bacterium]
MAGKGIDNSAARIQPNDGGYTIITTRWNTEIVDGLLAGATEALLAIGIGAGQIRVECVPGAFDGEVALRSGKPVAFGVLTVDTLDQALERSGQNDENKGAEAALSAVEMVNLIRALAS